MSGRISKAYPGRRYFVLRNLSDLILIRGEFFVHLYIRLFDPGICSGGKGHVQAVREVPAQAESTVPVELGTEGHLRFVAGVFQVAQLHFVIVTHHGCLETDVRRQVVQAELLDVTGVTVVLLQLLERAERFRIRCVVVGEVTAVILGRFIFRFRILRFRLAE